MSQLRKKFRLHVQFSATNSENNNFRAGVRLPNNNDDSEDRLQSLPHQFNHQNSNSQYSSSLSSASSSSGHHHHHPYQTSRLSSKSTNDLKTHQFSSNSSSALLGVDENHPQGSWPPDDRPSEERDSPDHVSSSSSFRDSSSGCHNESGSPSPRLISTSSLASSRQSSASQLQQQQQHQQQQQKNRVRSSIKLR